MNNTFGKVLVVFVTACSLGFAAFALSLVTGGPNWKLEAESEDFTDDFLLNVQPGEKPKYSIKDRRTEKDVPPTSGVLADVVVAGRKKQVTDAQAEDKRLSDEIAKIKPILAEMKALIPQDEAGIVVRALAYDKSLTLIHEAIQKAAADFAARSVVIKQVHETAKERREEGFRLKNQLELLRTDLFVAQAQQKILEDELVRVEENLKRLERREQQLKNQVEPYAETDGK